MAGQPKIKEKQIAAFASGQKTASGVPRRPSNPGYCFTADLKKRPQADRHLENTLVNNIGISEPLTKREVQILRSILAGKTNKQIALMLSRSRRTIEYHRNRLMRKLDARNAVELVKRAVAMGIV
ncbi:MAG: response regulator transcription factor [Planctomycetota bacterium]|jgi:DNA-binding NarL/FixJ family response regulator